MLTQKISLEEQETEFCSPQKMGSNCFQHHYISGDKAVSPTEMSETEADLYSRQVVKNIIQLSHNQTIRHEINQISKDCQLYAKPGRYNARQFHFDHIPPRNPNYSSSCSAKIKQINRGLQNKSDIIDIPSKKKDKNDSRHQSQGSKPRISVSGIVTCKFHSVNAQRSLGFNQIDHEEKMKANIKASQKMALCPHNRRKAILQKTSQNKYREELRRAQSINSNFHLTTSDYLKDQERREKQEMLIYGEKAKKLHFIKEYMVSQKADYEEGRHIVHEIDRLQPTTRDIQKKVCKTEVDQDRLIRERRMPVARRKIKVRFLTFVD